MSVSSVRLAEVLNIVPAVLHAPHRYLWSSYDADADVLYVNFKKPAHATDSELTEDAVTVRYEGDEVIGTTILRASKRKYTRANSLQNIAQCSEEGERSEAMCPK
jgi:uncharacterized protein YuzE